MRAQSIDREKALAVFQRGNATPRDLAVQCNVHTSTAIWFIRVMERKGILSRINPQEGSRYPDFGIFTLANEVQQ